MGQENIHPQDPLQEFFQTRFVLMMTSQADQCGVDDALTRLERKLGTPVGCHSQRCQASASKNMASHAVVFKGEK